jgi:putative tryptophan/tyrosine transport system substrate-binding protein
LLSVAAAWPLSSYAQAGRVRRIALLFAYDAGNSEVQGWLATFRDGLAKLGWIEGQNLHFEFRFTGSDTTLMEKAVKGIIVGVHDRQSVSHV